MPNKSLKALCRMTGLKQHEFAKRLGIPYRTLVAVMAGQRKLTRDKAELLMIRTGVSPESVMEDYDEPLTISGQLYTSEFYKIWDAQISKGRRLLDIQTMKKTALHLQKLQEVAQRKGQLIIVQHLFQRWLNGILKNLRLRRDFNSCFDPESPERIPVIQFRNRRLIRSGTTECAVMGGKEKKIEER